MTSCLHLCAFKISRFLVHTEREIDHKPHCFSLLLNLLPSFTGLDYSYRVAIFMCAICHRVIKLGHLFRWPLLAISTSLFVALFPLKIIPLDDVDVAGSCSLFYRKRIPGGVKLPWSLCFCITALPILSWHRVQQTSTNAVDLVTCIASWCPSITTSRRI